MSKRVAIGIDLGTTNSCVGVFQNGKVEIIANSIGSRTTPSCVAFTPDEILVGNAAKDQVLVNTNNTIFEAKRLIGRKFADATVQEDIKQWPFEVFDDGGAPKFKVQLMSENKVYSPEQISAMILQNVKKVAEDYIGKEVQDAVITVPAYFNDSQRQATIDAGKIAGLNVLHILNEPTAAALAYGFDKRIIQNKNVLVFDFGGGTFDVSIMSLDGKDYKVKAVGGDTHLGGGDFDSKLVEHFLTMIKRKHGKDLSGNNRALGRLRRSCEVAKIKLSTAQKTNVDIDCLFDGKDFQASITRKRFEEICTDLFKKTIDLVASVIEDSDISKEEIHEVILVGGSSRIFKIQEMLKQLFDGKKLNGTVNPDEAVAYGAAVRAAVASGEHTIEEITLADVVPLSLGKRNGKNDNMSVFIKRNSRIPITVVQKHWSTKYDYQRFARTEIYEGERKRAADNNLLGTFKIDIGERELAGVPKLTYTFTVDVNGILHVSGENKKTQRSGGISITSNKGRLSKEEIERMVQEAKTCTTQKQSSQDAGPAKEALESYCINQKETAQGKWDDDEITEADYDSVVSWCDQVLEWLDDNDRLSKWNYDEKLSELKEKCSLVLNERRPAALTFNAFLL